MLKLNYPGRNPARRNWCGPFALAMISGISYDAAYAKALDVEKRRLRAQAKKRGFKPDYWTKRLAIKGLNKWTLVLIAKRLGVTVKWVFPKWSRTKLTLLTFVREHTVKDHVYLVIAGNHYETICNGILYHAHHKPLPVEDAPKYRMAHVECWADVRVRPAAVLVEVEQQAA